jgi:hypothetical protein
VSCRQHRAPVLSVAAVFAERDAQRRRDQEADEVLQRRKEEELEDFRTRLDRFQLTDEIIKSGLDRVKRAFECGETELMIPSFPSSFCADAGRAIINAGVPPINKPSKEEEEAARQAEQPDWLMTLPKGVLQVYDFWKRNLKPGGFKFNVRIINYPGEKPGDVGLFFSIAEERIEGELMPINRAATAKRHKQAEIQEPVGAATRSVPRWRSNAAICCHARLRGSTWPRSCSPWWTSKAASR